MIGFACLGLASSMGWSVENGSSGVAGSLLGWLGSINLLLALFNLIPGYPLDGGRILRSALWAWYQNANRAARTAALTGQLVAGVLIALGLVQVFSGAGVGGLWLAFIGWFLLSAAQASHQQVTIAETLRDVRVSDVMVNDCATAEPRFSVQKLVDDVLLRTGRRCVVVQRDHRVMGLVTIREVRAVERSRWPEVTAAEVMRPLDEMKTVRPDAPVTEALQVMAREDINQMPVVVNGHLEGVLNRSQILQLLQSRLALADA